MDVNLEMRYLLALARDWPAGCDRRKGGGVVSEAGRVRVLEVWTKRLCFDLDSGRIG